MIQISKELAQATINYLASKPYAEVFQLINAYQQAVNLKPDGPKEGDTDPGSKTSGSEKKA